MIYLLHYCARLFKYTIIINAVRFIGDSTREQRRSLRSSVAYHRLGFRPWTVYTTDQVLRARDYRRGLVLLLIIKRVPWFGGEGVSGGGVGG